MNRQTLQILLKIIHEVDTFIVHCPLSIVH